MPLLSKVLPGTKYDRPWGLQGLHRLLSIVFILRCTRYPLATRAMRPTLAPRGGSKTVSGVYDAQQGACLKFKANICDDAQMQPCRNSGAHPSDAQLLCVSLRKHAYISSHHSTSQ